MQTRFESLLTSGSDFDLWMNVAQAALDRRWTHGIESITPVQRIAIAVWVASGTIGNRGFFDHSQEDLAEWAASYDALGMAAVADAIREAAQLMLKIDWNNDDPMEQLLDPFERRYYAANKATESLIAELIRQQPAEAIVGLT